MGKSLIIQGGNFQANAITDLSDWVDISSGLKIGGVHRQYINYPTHNDEQLLYNANALNSTCVCAIDVSAYVGKRIRVYWSQQRPSTNYDVGCWWRVFASAVASGVTFPWNGTTSVNNAVTPVQHISGTTPTGTTLGAEYSVLEVPTNARYLIFSNNTEKCPAPKVWVEAD